MRHNLSSFGDFRCGHCGHLVSSMSMFSGVNNRNHCPYCLWSCHLDLYSAGDRLSACKGQMMPIGLTMKKSRNKYRLHSRGELMLVHSESILEIFQLSLDHSSRSRDKCRQQRIEMLDAGETELVHGQLYGYCLGMPTVG